MRREDYTAACICALPIELAPMTAMLDEVHPSLEQQPYDNNTYSFGRIGSHNIVIACLPSGIPGTTSAAHVANHLRATFPSIKHGLLVGVGGGVPGDDNAIRLGDIVVSKPTISSGGIIQYDAGKTVQDGRFQHTGRLNRPPDALLSALAKLEAQHMLQGSKMERIMQAALIKHPNLRTLGCEYQGKEHDLLFAANYDHENINDTCVHCDKARMVPMSHRHSMAPVVHYGAIASGNQVMRHGITRDRYAKGLGVKCFEMEAAGLIDHFPCLVIRGICDYADSHKNKRWQPYAALVAAAYATELLEVLPSDQLFRTRNTASEADCMRSLYFLEMESRQSQLVQIEEDTCQWLLEHQTYADWTVHGRVILWLKGKPGAGKSSLMKCAVDSQRTKNDPLTLSFFFHARGNDLQKTAMGLYRSLLWQILDQDPESAVELVQAFAKKCDTAGAPGEKWSWNEGELRDFLGNVVAVVLKHRSLQIYVDALDECGEKEAKTLVETFARWISRCPPSIFRFGICFSCRHYPIRDRYPGLTICVEDENSDDIELYIRRRLKRSGLSNSPVETKIIGRASGVFQWVSLVIDQVEDLRASGYTTQEIESRIELVPEGLEELYKDIMERLKADDRRSQALKLFQWTCFAKRPLTLDAMRYAMVIDADSQYKTIEQLEAAHDYVDSQRRMLQRVKSLSYGLVEVQEQGPLLPEDEEYDMSPPWAQLNENNLNGHQTSPVQTSASLNDLYDSDGSANYMNYVLGGNPYQRQPWRECRPFLTVQFIHQSVKDFMLETGLAFLGRDDESTEEVLCRGHDQLFKSCLLYVGLFIHHPISNSSFFGPETEWDVLLRFSGKYRFLQYASLSWMDHAIYVEKTAIGEPCLLDMLEWPSCALIANLMRIHAMCDDHYPDFVQYTNSVKKTLYWSQQSTPLHFLAFYGLAESLALVIRRRPGLGTTVNAKDDRGCTALYYAAANGHYTTLRLLLQQAADCNSMEISGSTPWIESVAFGDLECVKLMLQFGADPNAQDRYGQTPLSHASLRRGDNSSAICRELCLAGAETEKADFTGRTPLSWAALELNEDALRLLIQQGADVNVVDHHQLLKPGTPLTNAMSDSLHLSFDRQGRVIEALLKHGADPNIPDITAFKKAIKPCDDRNILTILNLLMEHGLDETRIDVAEKHFSKRRKSLLGEFRELVRAHRDRIRARTHAAEGRVRGFLLLDAGDGKELVDLV